MYFFKNSDIWNLTNLQRKKTVKKYILPQYHNNYKMKRTIIFLKRKKNKEKAVK